MEGRVELAVVSSNVEGNGNGNKFRLTTLKEIAT